MKPSPITDADRKRIEDNGRAYETSIKKDCALILLKAQFDCLWKQVENCQISSEFCSYLEEYEFYDIDRARDILAGEVP